MSAHKHGQRGKRASLDSLHVHAYAPAHASFHFIAQTPLLIPHTRTHVCAIFITQSHTHTHTSPTPTPAHLVIFTRKRLLSFHTHTPVLCSFITQLHTNTHPHLTHAENPTPTTAHVVILSRKRLFSFHPHPRTRTRLRLSIPYHHYTENKQVGIEVKFKGMHYPVLISPSRVPELQAITRTPDGGVLIGGAASLSSVERSLAEIDIVGRKEGGAGGAAGACVDMLRWFASTQIRNVACLAGEAKGHGPFVGGAVVGARQGTLLV